MRQDRRNKIEQFEDWLESVVPHEPAPRSLMPTLALVTLGALLMVAGAWCRLNGVGESMQHAGLSMAAPAPLNPLVLNQFIRHDWSQPIRNPGAKSPVLFRDSYLTSGPLILDTPATVAHVTWNGTALVDSKGNTWTMNGTVPQVTGAQASPLFPSGFTSAPRSGAGPSSNSNNYESPAGLVIPPAGHAWSWCMIHIPTTTTDDQWLAHDNSGYLGFATRSGGSYYLNDVPSGGAPPGIVIGNYVLNAVNVVCYGYTGSVYVWKNNGAATSISTADAYNPTEGTNLFLGGGAGGAGFAGTMFEFWASTDTPSDALFTAIQERVFNEIADTGQIVADSRSTTATYYTNDVRWVAPVNVPRVEVLPDGGGGLLATQSYTEYLLNNTAPVTQTTASLSAGTYTANSLGTGGIVLTFGTGLGTGLPCTTTTYLNVGEGGDCVFTVSTPGTVVATVAGTVAFEQLTNTPFRLPDVIAGGTATTVSADSISLTNPGTAAGKPWCASLTIAPYAGHAWSAQTTGLLGVGASVGAANSIDESISMGLVDQGSTYDATGTIKTASNTLGNSNPATLVYCNDGAGNLTQWVNGSLVSSTINGAGTGVLGSTPTTMYLGSLAGGGTSFANGYITRAILCNSANGAVCK